jgi:hypothetical protein
LYKPGSNEGSQKGATKQAEHPKIRVAHALVEEEATCCQQKASCASGFDFDLQIVDDA